MNVHDLVPLSQEMFYPSDEDQATPFTKEIFRINAKYKDLDGYYRILLTADGKPYKTINEPLAEIIPTFLQDEGKRLGISILYRSFQSKDYVVLNSTIATIQAPPLSISAPVKIHAGEEFRIRVFYGIEGNYSLPETSYLEVKSDGFFMPKALNIPESKRKGLGVFQEVDLSSLRYDSLLKDHAPTGRRTFEFVLKPTDKMQPAKSKSGELIKVTFIDPVTDRIVEKTFVIQAES